MVARIRRVWFAGVGFAALLFGTGEVQAQECGPEQVTEWWPRRRFQTPPASATERAAMESKLAAAEALIRQTVYSKPRGFAVRPGWSYGGASPGRLRTFGFAAIAFDACSRYDEHGADFAVTFNPDPQQWSESDRPMPDESGDGLYMERVRAEPLFGSTVTFGHFQEENGPGFKLLFTVGGESPTVPVTREEYLRAVIFGLEGKDQANVKEVLAYTSKTQYQRWLESAAERKKRIEETVAGVAMVDPSQVAKVRADLERADSVAGETLRKEEPSERAELARAKANATAAGDKLRAQIAAMTPAERAAPAWLVGFDFVPAGTPNAYAIVRMKPDFYRARTSPVEVRAILVEFPNPYRQRQTQHRQLYEQFDWAALKRLLGH